jgi:hypothetical protein
MEIASLIVIHGHTFLDLWFACPCGQAFRNGRPGHFRQQGDARLAPGFFLGLGIFAMGRRWQVDDLGELAQLKKKRHTFIGAWDSHYLSYLNYVAEQIFVASSFPRSLRLSMRKASKARSTYDYTLEENSYPSDLLEASSNTVSPTKLSRGPVQCVPNKRKASGSMARKVSKRQVNENSFDSDALPMADEAPPPPPTDNSEYELYIEAVLAHCAGFYRVTTNFFVVQGWDAKRGQSAVGTTSPEPLVENSPQVPKIQDSWYHLQFVWAGTELCLGCSCPQGSDSACFHCKFFRDYDVEHLEDNTPQGAGAFGGFH